MGFFHIYMGLYGGGTGVTVTYVLQAELLRDAVQGEVLRDAVQAEVE